MAYKRIDSLISSSGVMSRSSIKTLIKKGLVSAGGMIIKSPSEKVDTLSEISVDGKRIYTTENICLMMNKPAGYVSTTDKTENSIMNLIPENLKRKGLFAVGRLDKDTEGLLLITDDGDLSHRITSPKKNLEKTYIAELSKDITEADIKLFQEGMILKDGFKTKPACLTRLAPRLAEVRIREGRYHQVKRMFACSGNSVLSLKRISIGGLTLDKELEPGEVRPLLKSEINKIFLIH